jgi:small-conductance mechanosensitive channel
VTVQNGSDPEKVRDTLIELAKAEDLVTRLPAPQVVFTAIEASGLSFELVCFVADVETSLRAKSDLHFAIFKRFAEEKIAIAPPAPPPTSIAFAPETQAAIVDSLRRTAE